MPHIPRPSFLGLGLCNCCLRLALAACFSKAVPLTVIWTISCIITRRSSCSYCHLYWTILPNITPFHCFHKSHSNLTTLKSLDLLELRIILFIPRGLLFFFFSLIPHLFSTCGCGLCSQQTVGLYVDFPCLESTLKPHLLIKALSVNSGTENVVKIIWKAATILYMVEENISSCYTCTFFLMS